jgi:hypothetical protein
MSISGLTQDESSRLDAFSAFIPEKTSGFTITGVPHLGQK